MSVTIGLPVHNGEAFLDEALRSLTTQTHPELEILVSDNASTDETPHILEKWSKQDHRIRIYRQPHNIGGWPNFKWVLNNAKNDFFMYAAYDDRWSSNYVSTLYTALQKMPSARVAVGQIVIFDGDKKDAIRRSIIAPPDGNYIDAIRTMHSGGYYGLFHKEALIKSLDQIIDYKHDWGGDFAVMLPTLLSKQVTADNQAIYYKRLTPLSEQRYRPKSARQQYIVYRDFWREIYKALRLSPLPTSQKVMLLPTLLRYAKCAGKPRRIIKTWVYETFRKMLQKRSYTS